MSLDNRTINLITVGVSLCMLIIFVVFFEFTTVFPTHIGSFYKNDPALSFPSVRENLSGPVLLLLCIITPMLCMILPRLPSPPSDPFFYWLPTFGNLLTLIITNALKCITGELRPSFLALCKVNESIPLEDNFVNRSMSAIICTGEEALDGRHSFPSSHCSQAFFGGILSILILQKLPILQKSPELKSQLESLWLTARASLQFLILTFSSWVAVSRLVDYHHHWWDVLAGSLLGALFAVVLFYWYLCPIMKCIEESPDSGTQSLTADSSDPT